jgi:hypothetical protein
MKAIHLRASRANRRSAAAVRLRVDPPELRDDLLEFLRATSCLGVKHGPDEIEVHLLNSVSQRHDRALLAGCVESWKAGHHSDASVEIVSG